MRKRSGRRKYAPYVAKFAEVYVANHKNASAAAREMRKRYPELCGKLTPNVISQWLRYDRHGFVEEVKAAEQRGVVKVATRPRRWIREEIMRLEARKCRLEARYEEECEAGMHAAARQTGYDLIALARLIRDFQKDYVLFRNEMGSSLEDYWNVLHKCLTIKARELGIDLDDDEDEDEEDAEEEGEETPADGEESAPSQNGAKSAEGSACVQGKVAEGCNEGLEQKWPK